MRNLVSLLCCSLKPHGLVIVGFLALSVLAAAIGTAAPALMGKGIDAATSGPWYLVALYLGAWTVCRLLGTFLRQSVSKRGEHLSYDVGREDNLRRIMALMDKPLAFHADQKRREVMSGISRLRWQLQNLIAMATFGMIPTLLSAVLTVAYVATFDLAIAAALFLSIAYYVAYTVRSAPERNESLKAWNELTVAVDDFQGDAVENVMLVKACTNEDFVKAAILERQRATRPAESRMLDVSTRQQTRQELIILFGSTAATALAVVALAQGQSTAGQVASVIAYSFATFGYVQSASWTVRIMFECAALLEKVDGHLSKPAEDFDGGRAVALTGAVEFRNVAFSYQADKPVLEGVSFTAPAGKRIALIGRSGEGKTTIVDLLGRYYAPSSGEILIDGVQSQYINLRSLRSQIAYVPQETTLFHESVDYNIRFGRPTATDEEVRQAARFARIDEFIESLPEKYETTVGEKGLKLSGGQRQRISLARAFLRNPRVLILDEPTSQQDSETEAGIQQSLEELMRDRTTFVIAHRLKTIMDADLILVLQDGRIAESGTHTELAKRPDSLYLAALRAQGMVAPDPLVLNPRSLN